MSDLIIMIIIRSLQRSFSALTGRSLNLFNNILTAWENLPLAI